MKTRVLLFVAVALSAAVMLITAGSFTATNCRSAKASEVGALPGHLAVAMDPPGGGKGRHDPDMDPPGGGHGQSKHDPPGGGHGRSA